jgi:hypothetical protein
VNAPLALALALAIYGGLCVVWLVAALRANRDDARLDPSDAAQMEESERDRQGTASGTEDTEAQSLTQYHWSHFL